MAQTKRYALNVTYQNGVTEYTGPEIARVHRILDSQLGGTLEALGTGVVYDPDETSLQVVDAGGLAVTVQPGRAFVRHSTLGGCALELLAPLTLNDLEPDATLYLFAALDVSDDNDSRESALPVILVQESDTCDGGVLLAILTTGNDSVTIEDKREPFSIDALVDALAAAVERIETLETTLAALLSGGGEGETPPVLWGMLKRAIDDDRTVEAVMDEKIAAAESRIAELIATGGRRPMQTKDDVFAHELAIYRQETGKTQLLLRKLFEHLEIDWPVDVGLVRSQSANIVGTSAETEIYGDGSSGFPDHLGPTTLTENTDGSFEP